MPDQPMEWAVPVKSSVTGRPAFLKIKVADTGELVYIPPAGPGYVLPETSEVLLDEARSQARDSAARRPRDSG